MKKLFHHLLQSQLLLLQISLIIESLHCLWRKSMELNGISSSDCKALIAAYGELMNPTHE